jgi:hypothetical protein
MAARTAVSDEQVRAAHEASASGKVAACALGISTRTYYRRLQTLGIKPARRVRYPELSVEAVRVAYARTNSAYVVAREFDVPVGVIYDRLRRGSVKREGRPDVQRWTSDEKAILQAKYPSYARRGELAVLAAELGRTIQSVRSTARLLGLQQARVQWKQMGKAEAREWFDSFKKSRLTAQNFAQRRRISLSGFRRTMKRFFRKEYERLIEAMWAKNTWYVKGRNVELKFRKDLEKHGYKHVVRSFRSRGIADLTAIGPAGALLVQVKRGGYLRPAEHNELWALSQATEGTAAPILAGMPDGRELRYWLLTGEHTTPYIRPIKEITMPLTWPHAEKPELRAA